MDKLSIWRWIVILGILFGYVVPIALILRKAGYSGWWSILSFLPFVSVIVFWVLALSSWPNLRDSEARPTRS